MVPWLYNNANRSMFAVILFHSMLNVGRSVAYPTIGSHFDPVYQATGNVVAFVMAVSVLLVWGGEESDNGNPVAKGTIATATD